MSMPLPPITVQVLRGWRERITHVDLPTDDGERIDEIREIEQLKCALEARQARLAAAFDASQRAIAASRGLPEHLHGRGVAEQIALARRVSPRRGRQMLGLAKVLSAEMPNAKSAFDQGHISEWRATILARETACLELADRRQIDRELASDPVRLSRMGDRELAGRARARGAELDAASIARRQAKAESERTVTIRPAPDAMVYLTALLPVAQGVAAYASLKRAADAAVAAGIATNRGQVMADTLAARVLSGDAPTTGSPAVPVGINLTMSLATLFQGANLPARVEGFGPIPGGLARAMVADAVDARTKIWIRRLFTAPEDGRLIAMESGKRFFPRQLAEFIRLRDQWCRTPWCNAPIRHIDHAEPVQLGGRTSVDNGQGLCEQCNHAKQATAWRVRPVSESGQPHQVEITTPAGRAYRSSAPPTGPPEVA
ncbi:HNH endonuclease [Nocardioides sp.]|uniref:HNH endonuclease n=1 Tax=Nocardioides sp. TaxID=35761 RepID=UPI0039E690D3